MARASIRVNTLLHGVAASGRLSRDDWVKGGLVVLKRGGAGDLKAEPLAKALGVSRGSFYWHFEDVAAFHSAVLDAWEDAATSKVIEIVDRRGGAPDERLRNLVRLAFKAGGGLERQVRAWASTNPTAAAAQDRVDRRRLAYVADLLAASGLTRKQAATRANLLYLALIGQFSVGKSARLSLSDLGDVLDLLLNTGA